MIVGIQDLDVRILLCFFFYSLHALLQIWSVLISSQDRDDSLTSHFFGQLFHDLVTAIDIICAKDRKPLTLWCVRIKHRHGYAAINRLVDRVGKLVSVRGADGNTART